jgi:hypothetical protein
MAFDKNKPYGEIYGKIEGNARYVQDGILYNARGIEVGREPKEEDAAPPLVRPKGRLPRKAPKVIGRTPRVPAVDSARENRQVLIAEELAE